MSLLKLIKKKIKWETLTKIIDWEKGNETGNYFPSIETYINHITTKVSGVLVGRTQLDSIGYYQILVLMFIICIWIPDIYAYGLT